MFTQLFAKITRTQAIISGLFFGMLVAYALLSWPHPLKLFSFLVKPTPVLADDAVISSSAAAAELPETSSSSDVSSSMVATATEQDLDVQGFVATVKVLTDLVQHKNPTAAFNALRSLEARDPRVATQCHDLAHAIGDAAYLKYGNFKDAFAYNDYMCGSGYIHSLVVNTFKETEDPTPLINTICAGQDGYCFHGIGHGLMFFTHNDVPSALDYCAKLESSEEAARCSEGVFMQNFEAGQDDPTPYVYVNDPLKLCRDEPRYKTACYLYAGEYLAASVTLNSDVFALCDASEPKWNWKCVSGMGAYIMAIHLSDPKHAERVCNGAASQTTRNSCIDGMVSYTLVNYNSIPRAEALCSSLEAQNQVACQKSLDARRAFYQ